MSVFFTSDTHFGHANAIKHGRPFKDIDEMREIIIQNWNKVVKPNDLVIHFGDFAMGQRDIVIPAVRPRLNGKIMLLYGNHDYVGHLHKHKSAEKAERWQQLYGAAFFHMEEETTWNVCGIMCQLAHLPFVGDHEGTTPRFLDQRPQPKGMPLLHGHVHDSWLVRQEADLPMMFNVGVDMHDFAPWSEEELEPWLK